MKLIGTLARIVALCKSLGTQGLNFLNGGIAADPGGDLLGVIFSNILGSKQLPI